MPRTKVAKSTAKRVREGDDHFDAKIKDFESRCKLGLFSGISHIYSIKSFSFAVNFVYQDIEYKFNEKYNKIDQDLETFRCAIPVEIQDLKIGDLKRLVRAIAILPGYLDHTLSGPLTLKRFPVYCRHSPLSMKCSSTFKLRKT